MAKETYVKRCYNWEVNGTIAIYECFGWELVSNNVVTSLNNEENMNLASENDLTFSRDKDSAWYPEVSRLQQEYISYNNQMEQILATDPTKKIKFHWILFLVGMCICSIGLLYAVIHIVMVVCQKNKEKEWHAINDAKLAELESKKTRIAEESLAIVNSTK